MQKVWKVTSGSKEPVGSVEQLRDVLCGIRGLNSADENFFELRYDNEIHNPDMLHGMRRAVDRIFLAIKRKERILIHGDYDADGITGTAIQMSVLQQLGAQVSPWLPHRVEHGYGLNQQVLESLVDDFDLLIKNLKKIIQEKKKQKSKTPFIDFQFIIFKYNEDQIEKVKKLARDVGVNSLKLRPGIIDDDAWLPKNKQLRSKPYVNKRNKKKACWWLWRTTHITWNGNILPCCRVICNKPFGNIFKEPFKKIWNNKQFVESRKCFSSKKKRDSPCYSCKILYGNIHG